MWNLIQIELQANADSRPGRFHRCIYMVLPWKLTNVGAKALLFEKLLLEKAAEIVIDSTLVCGLLTCLRRRGLRPS